MKKKSQKYKAIIDKLSEKILESFNALGKKEVSPKELFKNIKNINPFEEPLVDEVVDLLIEQNVFTVKKNKLCLAKEKDLYFKGLLSLHPRGFGFVKIESQREVFIPKSRTLNAVDGDLVEVSLLSDSSSKNLEGKIVNILERNRTHLGGTLTYKRKELWVAHVPLMPGRMVKIKTSTPYIVGDRVIINVTDWGQDDKDPILGVIFKKVGHIDDPSTDIPAAIEEFQLHDSFSHAAVNEAKKWGTKVPSEEIKKRTNLIDDICITVDPTTAKDFDDALSLTIDNKGNYHLGVHIADVAHYVRPNSQLDKEAFQRANSVYFPNSVLPMLPFELSANLCSLKEKEKRLTISVLMDFDSSGHLISHKIVRTVIESKKRFTYEEAYAIIQKKEKDPLSDLIIDLSDLGQKLKKIRTQRGSINFSLDEAVVKVEENGTPVGMVVHEYDLSHQMVEEFMLKANEVIATHLDETEPEAIFRIHEQPKPESIDDFFSFARALGYKVSPKPTSNDIQKIFNQAKNTPHIDQLSVYFIRSMKLAQYSPQNIGHYGLSLEHYTHFTSPIRRYSDLIVQRLLFNDHDTNVPLSEIADHCSRLERISAKAEQSVLLLKKLRLIKAQWETDKDQVFSASITNIKQAGLIFEINNYYLEGFIPIFEISKSFLDYNPKRIRLQNKKTGFSLSLGQKIQVHLNELDLTSSQTRWELSNPKN